MKIKNFLTIILLLEINLSAFSNSVTAEQAREKAKKFLMSNSSGSRFKARAQESDIRMSCVGENDSYFVFNIGQADGFVIVNGEDGMDEIIGYAEGGTYDEEHMPENMKAWMQGYVEQIEWVRNNKDAFDRSETQSKVDDYEEFMLDTLKLARWGQSYPFYCRCPRINNIPTVTGCAPTAMAQLLYWHKSPAKIMSKIPAIDMYDLPAVSAGTSIDWCNIKQTWDEHVSDEEINAVASFVLYCGQALKAKYTVNEENKASTSASVTDMKYALCKYFGYNDDLECVSRNDYSNSEWQWLVYSELCKNRPVLYRGSSATGSHAFLLEGYKDGMYYVNWGWYSHNNGFFKLDLLNGYNFSSVGYDLSQKALINVDPNGDASEFSAGLTTLDLSTDSQTIYCSSSDSKFPSFNVSAYVSSYNPVELDFREGFALYKDGEPTGKTWTYSKKESFGSHYYHTYSMDIELDCDLADAVYHLYPVSCESSSSNMNKNGNSDKYYIQIAKLGEKITLRTFAPGQATLTLDKFELRNGTATKVNCQLGFDITVTNNSNQAYSGDVKLCQVLFNNDEENNVVVSVTHLDLDAGSASTLYMEYVPTLEGAQVIRLLDKNNKTLGSTTIDIEHTPALEGSDWVITNGDFAEHILLGTTLEGSVIITNKDSLSFDGLVWFELIEAGNEHGSNISEGLQLDPGEHKEVGFYFENLTEEQNYYISVRFDDTAEYFKSETFVCKHSEQPALANGDTFTSKTIEGVEVTYTVTNATQRLVSVMGADGGHAVDENTTGSITLPSVVNGFLVSAIGDGAFAYLDGITGVYIPPTVKTIGDRAFFYCSGLTQVDGMEGVEVIGEIAFRLCENVTWFKLPNTLTTIGTQAFGSCSSLVSFTLPASVKWLEPGNTSYKLLEGCTSLKVIEVEEGNPYYDSREDCNAIIETATNTLYAGCKTTKIVSSIEHIGDCAFGFVDDIGTMEIPSSVKSIGSYAFAHCNGLDAIKIWVSEPFTIEDNTFYHSNSTIYNSTTLYVPSGSKAAYTETDGWKNFVNIEEFPVFDQEQIIGVQLVIYFTDGRSLCYSLTDRPKFSISGSDILFSTDYTELTFAGSGISRFVIEDRDEIFDPDAISTVREEASSRFVEGKLRVTGAKAGTPVHIYDISGTMVFAGTTDANGELFVDTSDRRPGIYIVNIGQTGFKMMKK